MKDFLEEAAHILIVSIGLILGIAVYIAPAVIPVVLVSSGESGWWFLLLLIYVPVAVFLSEEY